jgi:hypothetical protein
MIEPGTKNRLATAGLLVAAAFSLATAWGRKPPQHRVIEVAVRPMSATGTKKILLAVPGWLSSYDSIHLSDDTALILSRYPFMEVTAAPLKRAFPGVGFYNGLRGPAEDRRPYVVAITGHKVYALFGASNSLLSALGVKLTRKNVLELAEAFVVLWAAGARRAVRHVTVLGKSLTHSSPNPLSDPKLTDRAWLKVDVDGDTLQWYFEYGLSQFGVITVRDVKGEMINQFNVPEMQRE